MCFWWPLIRLTPAPLTFGICSAVSDNRSHQPLPQRTLAAGEKLRLITYSESTEEDLKRLLPWKRLLKVIWTQSSHRYSSARCVGLALPHSPLEAAHSTVPAATATKVLLVTDLEMAQLKHLPRGSRVPQWVKPPAHILPPPDSQWLPFWIKTS